MKIWTTYYAGLKKLPRHILPVSIAGWPPKGWKGEEYTKVAPRRSFFREYKETGDQESYTINYYVTVLLELSKESVVKDLENILSRHPECTEIALVCYEKPEDCCHRHILAAWLEEYNIKEWEEK